MAIGQAFSELTDGPSPDLQTRLALVGLPFGLLGVIQATYRSLWPALVAGAVVFPAMLFLRTGLWIVFAIVLVIASLFARSEIRAAQRLRQPSMISVSFPASALFSHWGYVMR